MVSVEKQTAYWCQGAAEDWSAATDLVRQGHGRHGLFFAHLALEKTLKAHVCRPTRDLAPRAHSLMLLAGLVELCLPPELAELLRIGDRFDLQGRYPVQNGPPLTQPVARSYLVQMDEVFRWLIDRL